MKINSCVQCGFCCGVGKHEGPTIRSYGTLNEDKTKCRFLEKDNKKLGTWRCLIRKEIKEVEKKSQFPMFDCGCSSSMFNTIRNKVINKMSSKKE
jgi:hypothetical protein